MKKYKKGLSLLLALVLMFSICTTANAADTVLKFTMTPESTTAKAGSQLKLAVSIDSNPGLWGFGFTIDYDNTKVVPEKGYEKDTIYGPGIMCGVLEDPKIDPAERNQLKMSYSNPLDFSNKTDTGEIVVITFNVLEDAEGSVEFVLTPTEGDNINSTGEGEELSSEGDSVTVTITNKGQSTETTTSEAVTSETTTSEVVTSETTTSEVVTSETTTSEDLTSETTTSEDLTSETTTSEVVTSETTTSEDLTSETTTSEDLTSETTTQTSSEASSESTTETSTTISSEASSEEPTETVSENTTSEAESNPQTSTDSASEPTTSRPSSSGGQGGSGGGSSSGGSGRKTTTASSKAVTSETKTETTTENVPEKQTEAPASAPIKDDVKITMESKNVTIGDKTYTIDAAPYIQASSSSALVPLRFVSVALLGENVANADTSKLISWDTATKTATITVNNKVIKFTSGSPYMIIDGKSQLMENGVKAEIKDSRMYIPFRALGTALGVKVDWDVETKTAIYKVK